MLSKKIKAFTLVELIIAMIISGLVIAIASTGYLMVTRQFEDYRKNNRIIQDAFTLRWLLNSDFTQSKTVILNDEQVLQCNLNDGSVTSYTFQPGFIIRETPVLKDTFSIKLSEKKIFFQDDSLPAPGLVDKIVIDGKVFEENVKYTITKVYDADAFMNKTDIQ